MNIFPLAIAFLLGVCVVQGLAELHTQAWLVALILTVLASFTVPRGRASRLIVLLCLVFAGALWSSWRAGLYLQQRLPEAYAGKDVLVSGRVIGIPTQTSQGQRFAFAVDAFDIDNSLPALARSPQTLRLSWYYGKTVKAGERWQLRLRLKPPHGFYNPGGFDYERWLYQQGIAATGYVRDKGSNRLLAKAPLLSLDRIRQSVWSRIDSELADSPQRGVIEALAVGERSAISTAQWQQLLLTGTNHLVAISGLHIGLAAAFAYFFTRRLLARWLPAKALLWLPAQHMAIIAGLALAMLYALLAGMSIPTQRALIMLASFTAAALLRRNQWPFDALALALFLILVWEPASVLAPGFWFSFLAIAVIFYLFGNRGDDEIGRKTSRWLRWGGIQLAITLTLLPLSLFMFQQSSLIAPLANLIMVPFVSLLIVPLVLLGILLMPLWSWASAGLLSLAAALMQLIWPLMAHLASWHYAAWVRPQPALWSVLLAMLGIACLLAPRRWLPSHAVRAAAVVLLLPMLLIVPKPPAEGDFELSVLDVGQGLAVVVRTHGHALVYDTGAQFGDRLDAGSAVVVPFLRQLGVHRLDTLVVSHGDADHIGGAASILRSFPGAELVGRDIESLSAVATTLCVRAQHWSWDGVDFEFLHPVPGRLEQGEPGRRNNHSCVLRVSNAAGATLLTGDIEHSVERELLSEERRKLAAAVLVVPHHGSKTSSSSAFIAAVRPVYALISAGYRNRFRLPAAEILGRYRAVGVAPLITGQEGALSLLFSNRHGLMLTRRYRRDQRHFWNHLLIDVHE
jgi:competence protein ComEC